MKINQVLVESTQNTVAFAFGRFNPAHQGHIEVWRTVEQAGSNWFIGTNPSTLGPNDPLTFEQKKAWMEEIYPPLAGHIVPEQTVLSLAAYIFKKLRKNENTIVAYITDDTDWAWSGKLLNQYNGVEGAHGYYKFAEIIHEPSPRVSSATALREAARADDKVAFYHASGTDPKSKVAGLSYFDTVKQACEKYPLPVKRGQKIKESIEEAALDKSFDPSTQLSKVLRYLGRKVAAGFPILATTAGGVALAYSGLLAPLIASVGGATAFITSLGATVQGAAGAGAVIAAPSLIQAIKDLFAADETSIQAGIKRWVEKYVGDENDVTEFLALHAKTALQGLPKFRWRAKEWPVKMSKDQAEAHLEKHDKFWLEQFKAQQNQPPAMAEATVGNVLSWPELVNKVNGAMRAMGWKGQRREDGTFMYSTAGRASDDEYYIVIIENEGEGMFHYALGTVEEGDPYIGEQNSLPTTEASISELMNSIREGFGLGEGVAEAEQKTVAKTWDQMTPQEKVSGVKGRTVWNEKTRKYYTVFDVPVKQNTDEASLATMRDYFAGDKEARDPYEITKQRLHFDKEGKPLGNAQQKEFRSEWDYQQWLQKNKLKPLAKTSVKENVKQNWVQRVMERKK
jgi:hypothetical protein